MPAPPALIEKLNSLSVNRLAEVEDFVDFLRLREQDRALFQAACAASEPALSSVWNNPDDDAYDAI